MVTATRETSSPTLSVEAAKETNTSMLRQAVREFFAYVSESLQSFSESFSLISLAGKVLDLTKEEVGFLKKNFKGIISYKNAYTLYKLSKAKTLLKKYEALKPFLAKLVKNKTEACKKLFDLYSNLTKEAAVSGALKVCVLLDILFSNEKSTKSTLDKIKFARSVIKQFREKATEVSKNISFFAETLSLINIAGWLMDKSPEEIAAYKEKYGSLFTYSNFCHGLKALGTESVAKTILPNVGRQLAVSLARS